MTMHGKRGQGARRPHGEPCNDEQRSTRLPGASGATPAYWDRFLAVQLVRSPGNEFALVARTGRIDVDEAAAMKGTLIDVSSARLQGGTYLAFPLGAMSHGDVNQRA